MKIIKAKKEHLDDLVEIWKDFMDYHKAIDQFFSRSNEGHKKFKLFIESILDNKDYLIMIVIDSGKVLGYALAQVSYHPPVFMNTKFCLLIDIVVIDKFRGQGIGKKLFEEVKNWSGEKGINRIELKVAPGNKLGYAFYSRLGFKDFLHELYIQI